MSGSDFAFGITDVALIENQRLLASSFTPFVSDDISKRVNPKSVLPEAKSIIVVCVPHDSSFFFKNLSSLGTCEDYHKKVRDVLQAIALELAELHGAFKYKILVDSPTLCERSLAVRAGLGFFGKNGLVISPEFGSRFNIGVMLTDIGPGTNPFPNALRTRRSRVSSRPFGVSEPTSEVADVDGCPPGCNLCINACPNGALSEGKPLDARRCISYLTQKEKLSAEEEKHLHGQLYGCDICQNVCPKNSLFKASHVNPLELVELSDSEISEKFGHTAMSWKINLLKRNAFICNIC